MNETATILRSYVRVVRDLCGVDQATLYLAPSGEPAQPGLLLHDGEGSPAPELANLEVATRFARTVGSERIASVAEGGSPVPLQFGSADSRCVLLWVPSGGSQLNKGTSARDERRRPAMGGATNGSLGAWLGLRFADDTEMPPGHGPSTGGPVGETAPAWDGLLSLGAVLADFSARVSSILVDPVSGLPGRREFTSLLSVELQKARSRSSPLALLFINPDEFLRINELFGQETGDVVVREMSGRLAQALRAGDFLVRYGGVTFAAVLVGTTTEAVAKVAHRLLHRLSTDAYLDDAVRLDFSIGLAFFDPAEDDTRDPLKLIRRADQALSAAKRRGGGTVVVWEEAGTEQLESFDRLAGIFTGHVAKDYRNMVLLWDIVNIVAKNDEVGMLASATVRKLRDVLKPDKAGLFLSGAGDSLELIGGCSREGESGSEILIDTIEVDDACRELVERAYSDGEPVEAVSEPSADGSDTGLRCCAVPLAKGDRAVGALFLEWSGGAPGLDSSDQLFLRALGLQLVMALERIRLGEREVERQESEKRRLRAELHELRQAVQRAKLVYRSVQMEQVMTTARRVAGSDATVLITGPSGTGKELLARTVHELSPRREGPFVIVDCGAIPTTLIESELFGHEKGAYTGAASRGAGLIAQAESGTVLLDEIGELPLEVQSKLLRFVQDRVFKSVGGSRARKVDVRILAATNRDLSAEVGQGRFREDLFYRLNVMHLIVPALADRPDDIPLLARHFLELYSVHYQKPVHGMSEEAGRRLLEYSWPGNVRELQNCIMRAVLLSEGVVLGEEDLGLLADGSADGGERRSVALPLGDQQENLGWKREVSDESPSVADTVGEASPQDSMSDASPSEALSLEGLLDELSRELAVHVAAAAAVDKDSWPPLGRWLQQELLLAAAAASSGVVAQGASRVGLPASTYRRRLQQAFRARSEDSVTRPAGWSRIVTITGSLVRLEPGEGRSSVDLVEEALLREIVRHYPGNTGIGSALLGVTPPTFRRRVSPLRGDHQATG